jgi:hypothetical protein
VKSVLLIQYSQSGQLHDVARSVVGPLIGAPDVTLTVETLRPQAPYPFPWPVLRFFDTFPETVHLDAPPLAPLTVDPATRFDLVILAYQVWFLSPSLPVTAFLQSTAARQLLRDTPVVTLIACRDMWLMAQEDVKRLLGDCGARLVGNIALTDRAGSAMSFLATPFWVMSGHQGPFLGGLVPKAGVDPEAVARAGRFGERMLAALRGAFALDEELLRGLGAVRINERLIASERVGKRSFRLWGALLRAAGRPGALPRRLLLLVYIAFLVTLILTFLPISALVKRLLSPLLAQRIALQKAYFAAPSGE